MKIVIGADHRGYAHKEYIKKFLDQYEWIDVGTNNAERSDYPLFAHKAIYTMQNAAIEYTILLCGSGIGMAMAANRYPDIRSGVVWNASIARQAKEHDNVNVLSLPADYISKEESITLITVWLNVKFLGGRHQERLLMLDQG